MELSTLSSHVPIIGVIGRKNTGKTTIIEKLIRKFIEKDYKVATVKHINEKNFSMDTKGKDTWKHAEAGADPIISVSDMGTSLLMKDGLENFSLDNIAGLTPNVNVILLEGFSQTTLSNKTIGKIICVRNDEEYTVYKKKAKGKIIGVCGLKTMKKPILRIIEDSEIMARRAIEYIEKEIRVLEILKNLPRFDCEKCGYSSCYEMAVAIYDKKTTLDKCVPLSIKQELKTRITVNGFEIPIQSFVSEIIRSSVIGMISELKGVSIKGNENLNIELSG